MNRTMLRQYIKLVEFLGVVLGPTYEITLHDVRGKESSIVAIVNGSISGRTLDSPPTTMAMRAIADNAEGLDYRANYNGLSSTNKALRSSTYYIKDSGGNLVGMLCLNFDDSQFHAVTDRIFQLIHPDQYVADSIIIRSDILEEADTERFGDSVVSVADSVIQEVLAEDGVPVERLSQVEKVKIVAKLEQRGIFRLKGAVAHVSNALCSSPASIYRYLAQVRRKADPSA